MTCDLHANHCYFKGQPSLYYPYWDSAKFSKIQCELTKTLIYAKDTKTLLFNDGIIGCYAHNLYCKHKHGVTVWNSSIIHDCSYFKIKDEYFNQTGNLMASEFNLFQILKNYSESIRQFMRQLKEYF